ncbi:MAG TPA: hypothetical protein VH062_34530 [Polyangiaceae bacterium]|jgi:hypothetical protein|nr:hypothetical protein [Polyangiaceae bacterium]
MIQDLLLGHLGIRKELPLKSQRSAFSSSVLLFVFVTACGGGDFIGSSIATGGHSATDGGLESGSRAGGGSSGGSGSLIDGGSGGASSGTGGSVGGGGAKSTGGSKGSGGRGAGGTTTSDGGATSDGGMTGGGTTGSGGRGAGGATTSDGGASANGGTSSGGAQSSGGTSSGGTGNTGGVVSSGGSNPVSGGTTGSGGECANPVAWYVDNDQDGYGSSSAPALLSCDQPGPHYTKVGGDCHDGNKDVHPQVTAQEKAYFEAPYSATNGVNSFDYDCSGTEDGDPSEPKAASSCPALSAGACGGSGYLMVATGGRAAPNGYCGSKSYRTCVSQVALLCQAQDVTNFSVAYRCK